MPPEMAGSSVAANDAVISRPRTPAIMGETESPTGAGCPRSEAAFVVPTRPNERAISRAPLRHVPFATLRPVQHADQTTQVAAIPQTGGHDADGGNPRSLVRGVAKAPASV